MIVDMNSRQGCKSGTILRSAIAFLCVGILSLTFNIGVKVGRDDAYGEIGKRIEVIETLHKQDSIIQKLRKEAQNETENRIYGKEPQ